MFDIQKASEILTDAGACFHDSHDRIRACEVLARALNHARLQGRMEAAPPQRRRGSGASLRVVEEVEHSY